MKKRKIPLRRCTGCCEMKDKKNLVRVVHGADGSFCIDKTGKKPGRGAYVCPNMECLAKAVKMGGLSRSFKTAVPREVYSALEKELEGGYE